MFLEIFNEFQQNWTASRDYEMIHYRLHVTLNTVLYLDSRECLYAVTI